MKWQEDEKKVISTHPIPRSRALQYYLAVAQTVEKFHETQQFISVFTTFRQRVSHPVTDDFIPHSHFPHLQTYFNIFLSHLGPQIIFSSCFPNKIVYVFLISPMCATCPANFVLHGLITPIFGAEYKLSCFVRRAEVTVMKIRSQNSYLPLDSQHT
jgi:hypothetical protein